MNPVNQAHSQPATAPAERVLKIERRFDAPRALVFRAWTDPTHLVRWWGPEGFTVPECRMEVRPGGAWYTCMRSPDGKDHKVQGVYRELVAPERLSFTWAWLDDNGQPGHQTLVTVTLAEHGGQTDLTLVQEIFADQADRDNHRQGWSSSFVCLDGYLKTPNG